MRTNTTSHQTPQHLDHSAFGPLYSSHSRTLILGSFPSVKSREAAFYYGHPQNRFWRIIRALYDPEVCSLAMQGEPVDLPVSREEKTALILEHSLALWDTIYSCTIIGSSDSTIRDVVPCDIPMLLSKCPIERVFCNGSTSYNLFLKYCLPAVEKYCEDNNREVPSITKLPSTSPANAAWTLPKLLDAWKIIK